MTIDISKPLQTRDGRKARLLGECRLTATDLYPLVVAVGRGEEGFEQVEYFMADGHYLSSGRDSDDDLVNVPEEKVWFFNVYDNEYSKVYKHRDEAFARQGRTRDDGTHNGIGTIKAVFVEGKLVRAEIVE